MVPSLTVLIPTHNRHSYLQRAIAYYSSWEFPVLILDSTATAYSRANDMKPLLQYIHVPAMPLPQKLSYGLNRVYSEFVVLCADDDFLVSDGVKTCLQFLQRHRQYAVADGGILFYKKQDIFRKEINYNLLYTKHLDGDFTEPDSLHRLHLFFKEYRTLYYGVHYTKNLADVYGHCWQSYKNLYLNEYLTALYPITKGYCRILPVLTAVREYTDTSDDKLTANLDTIFTDSKYRHELESYIQCTAEVMHQRSGSSLSACVQTTTAVLQNYAESIPRGKKYEQQQSRSFIKRMGKILLSVPILGESIVRRRRRRQSAAQIGALIKSAADQKNLQLISQFIQQYRSIC